VSDQEPSSDLPVNWKAGNPQSLTALVPLVYDELRTLARRYLRKQRPQHTLQGTALVHEAYLRLKKQQNLHFDHPNQFFALAALVMRQVLVDYARGRQAAKRDAGWRLSLDDCTSLLRGKSVELIALDDALKDLARLDAQQSRIVELRFFGGLSIEETAEVLGVSPATVKRHWASARIWLFRELSKASPQ
jgi:RNA polymerase sigma factor (TIGR02999 family)